MAKKYRTIKEIVKMDREDLEGSLSSVRDTLNNWYSMYGGNAYLEIETYYDGYGFEISIQYDRQETDAERNKRLDNTKKLREQAVRDKARKVEAEKARLIDLLNKYGMPGSKDETQ
jgi:hypothetical protein